MYLTRRKMYIYYFLSDMNYYYNNIFIHDYEKQVNT